MYQLNLKRPLVTFDLESTGLNISKDRIVEYAFVKISPDGSKDTLEGRLNPGIPIPPEISLIHGIYDEDIKDAPMFKDVAQEIKAFLKGCDLCGFNIVKFDVPMLVEEFLREEIEFSIEGRKLLDAQRIFHLMEPRNLSAAYQFYCQKDLHNAHSALADAEATFEVFKAQVEKYDGKVIKDHNGEDFVPVQNDMQTLHKLILSNKVDLAGRMVYNQDGVEMFNFGKNRGRLVMDVLTKDPAYYDWFMNGAFPMESKQRLTEIRLKGLMSIGNVKFSKKKK